MKDIRREILSQVAAGTLSAEEGAARLDSLEAAGPAVEPNPIPSTPSAPPPGTAARQVRVVSQFGSAEIVGDSSVAFAIADGPHRARQEGDTMVIEHEPFDDADSFSFGHGERRIAINGFDIQRRKLTVRMNPDLALAISIQAGNVHVDGVHGSISTDVQAGNCKVADFRGTLNLVVQAGNVSASGRLDSGASKVRCEMGSVKISLERGSSVRITARTTLGKVSIESEKDERAIGQSGRDVVIGAGAATLDVDCTMGNVKVAVA
jgi:Putative adhesin